jgi:hypothetical protein
MARTFINRRTGQVYTVGRRMSVGGDDAIVGGDSPMMIVGDDGMPAQQLSLADQAALARQAGGFVVQPKQVAPAPFIQLLPFSVDVPAGSTVTVNARPQRTFRVDNLIVTSPEGPYFEISQWNVGQDNMFVAQGSVNCAGFSEGAAQKGLAFRGFTANQGAEITMTFENMDTDNAHRLSGYLSGPAIMKLG